MLRLRQKKKGAETVSAFLPQLAPHDAGA